MSFEKYGKIIEGYIELLTLFPLFHNLSLEHFEASKNAINVIISNRTEIWNVDNNVLDTKKPEIRIITYNFSLIQSEKIFTEDTNETKPE